MKKAAKVFMIIGITIAALVLAFCLWLAICDRDGSYRNFFKEAFDKKVVTPIGELFHPTPTSELVDRCISAYEAHDIENAQDLKAKLDDRDDYSDEMKARVEEAMKKSDAAELTEDQMDDLFGDLLDEGDSEDETESESE